MKKDCIFCKIADGRIKEEILYQDDDLFVVRDIYARAKTHLLIITKEHYSDFSEMMRKNPGLVTKIGIVVEKMVDQLHIRDISRWGYTWGFHCGGKESVSHTHAQLLAEMKQNEFVL